MKNAISWLLLPCLIACKSGDDDSGGTATSTLEPCEIVSEVDATALFGEPAVRDQGTLVTDPNYLGDCLWTYEPPGQLGSQNVALYLWQGEDYYEPRDEAEPFDIGDEGRLYESDSTGVDVEWIQGGKTAVLNYFTVGDGVPLATSKTDDVQALALAASSRF